MNEIQELRKQTGLTQVQFANYYGLNVRNLQNWESSKVKTPDYVLTLIKRVMYLESTK